MVDQPKAKSYRASNLFSDGTTARPVEPGTVPYNSAGAGNVLHSGLQGDGQVARSYPFTITMEDLKRGQERYNIYCSVCHGYSGHGDGMIVRRGFTPPPSFHSPRLLASPPGYFVSVITNGFGAMYSYNDRVAPADRWRIAAYIQALQLSQGAAATQPSSPQAVSQN